ncbi:YeiH family protein [Sphingosinicella rhizophila]|uniref:Sulfate exporter family transporter n=1 Tax=Sphingosinicella rhizophila TaxID=3050082 RepID=A0ABU3Q5I3_9SPHN|nr:putative sulfate exporter family transporter [Sphingosinicella sp. GR2756]MDT9598670.1 putative sulfate exporter family transporter [Sphingosinicella sp. GR2756]
MRYDWKQGCHEAPQSNGAEAALEACAHGSRPRFRHLTARGVNYARVGATALVTHLSPLATGLLLTCTIAVAARFLGTVTPLPSVFFALVIGMAFSGLGSDQRCAAGVDVSARTILRVGVALLGLQITFGDILGLPLSTVAVTILALIATLVVGSFIARSMGGRPHGSMVSAGAVAICGASAALAIAAALPKNSVHEEEVARTVAGITILGTVAMLTLPTLGLWLGLSVDEMGLLLGGTIHEVAQAVAAGFAVSDDVGQVATLIKLLRVACLGLVVIGIAWIARGGAGPVRSKTPLLPLFLVAFVLLALISSFGLVPAPARDAAAEISRWCLLIAIAALGVRTSFAKLVAVGSGPLLAIAANSALMVGIVLAGIWLIRV